MEEIFHKVFVTNLVLVLRLDHGGPLGAQRPHGLEDIDHPLVLEALEHDAQRDEDAGAANSGTEKRDLIYSFQRYFNLKMRWTYLQWTVIGPSWPNCSFVLCTCPTKSVNSPPSLGTPCSGQSVNWNWRTVRDWPSRASVTLNSRRRHCGMLYSARGSTTKHWYRADLSDGQYCEHFS